MTFDFVREWVELGKARGKAKAILGFLESRNVPVPQEARERILACTDEATLMTWISRAATVTTADELFD
ncbi:hypothetical protein FXF51_32605 [Nonomuraea sp. PA05]|uniref:hypothetical protein n=1 Tax=Nonomuraea sp. PA05 TaxID=2604466 RepID=UPI0011D990FD|nr:hypothetical protein [Nonomuraea sp. PA05]TYB59766.1 hypothetical protein FXF51_32605 [Nonomuraea sp. PA05]